MRMLAVRPYRLAELPAILERGVQTALAQVVGREAPGAGYDQVAGQLHRMYQNALGVPQSTILVVDWPNGGMPGPAAYALLMPQPNAFTAEPEVIIMDIFTDPAVRGRGVGRALLTGAADYARSIGCHGLVAQVALHNQPSLAMFTGSGFHGERVVVGKRL
jgi:GNAT superfamily N-acetyltransferase